MSKRKPAGNNADGDNRRTAGRAPALLRVDYPNLSGFMSDYSENISKSGIFIATDRPHEIGDQVAFQIGFPGLLEPLQLKGVVRWRRPYQNEEGSQGIGLELVFDAESDRERVGNLAEKAEKAKAQVLAAQAAPAAWPVARTFRIMLAEDNPHVREMFSYGMAKLAQMDIETPVKIQVVESVDGHDAWAKLNQGKFDLLIIDLYMPVLDGHGFIKRVRASAEHRHIPIVAVSAGSDVRAEALASGADIFLPKPVKLSDIVITVKTLLRLDL